MISHQKSISPLFSLQIQSLEYLLSHHQIPPPFNDPFIQIVPDNTKPLQPRSEYFEYQMISKQQQIYQNQMKESTQYLMSLESETPGSTRHPKSHLQYINESEVAAVKLIKSMRERKQAINKEIWANLDGNLQELFLQYPIPEPVGFTASELIETKGVKLIKGEHRIYYGQVIKTKKEGKGISIYSDGRIYEGYHVNNQKSGLGCEVYSNGNLYIGDFDRNKKHGKGTFYWLNLEQDDIIEYYIGEWWDGLPSGVGKHQRCNGDLYEGEFRNGLKHGQGTEHFSNQDIYKGQYVNGLPEGYGEYWWSNESNYKGEFKQGLRYGFGCWKKDASQNCESYRGHYLMDLKSGHGIYNWPDGKYYKGEFFNDKKHGYGELYNNQTLKYKGNWDDGKPSQNTSQIGENTLNRIRSNSGSTNSIRLGTTSKSLNQGKSTRPIINFQQKMRSRQPTFESFGSAIKQFRQTKLKRPTTVAPVDIQSLSKNSIYRLRRFDADSKSQSQSKRQIRSCHKNCIPVYPWERNKSTCKH